MAGKNGNNDQWSFLASLRFFLSLTVILGHYALLIKPDRHAVFGGSALLSPLRQRLGWRGALRWTGPRHCGDPASLAPRRGGPVQTRPSLGVTKNKHYQLDALNLKTNFRVMK